MNTRGFAEKYGIAFASIGSIAVTFSSLINSIVEPTENWSFLISPIVHFAYVYEVGYKDLFKRHHKKVVYIMFFLIPWLLNVGLALYRAMIKFGLT